MDVKIKIKNIQVDGYDNDCWDVTVYNDSILISYFKENHYKDHLMLPKSLFSSGELEDMKKMEKIQEILG